MHKVSVYFPSIYFFLAMIKVSSSILMDIWERPHDLPWFHDYFIFMRRSYSTLRSLLLLHDVRWRTSGRYSTPYHLFHFLPKLHKTRTKRSGSNLPARNCVRFIKAWRNLFQICPKIRMNKDDDYWRIKLLVRQGTSKEIEIFANIKDKT